MRTSGTPSPLISTSVGVSTSFGSWVAVPKDGMSAGGMSAASTGHPGTVVPSGRQAYSLPSHEPTTISSWPVPSRSPSAAPPNDPVIGLYEFGVSGGGTDCRSTLRSVKTGNPGRRFPAPVPDVDEAVVGRGDDVELT